jgi:hypothetical protein
MRMMIALIAGLSIGLAGCSGDKVGRQGVTGTVMFKGQPLKYGRIEFNPADGNKNNVTAGSPVVDGKYTIAADKGLSPGKYTVKVNAPDRVPEVKAGAAPGSDMDSGPPVKEMIPEEYNAKTKLTAEVDAKQTKPIDFDLK